MIIIITYLKCKGLYAKLTWIKIQSYNDKYHIDNRGY